MTPQAFIAKWKNNALSERAGAQPYFIDLCTLLGVTSPADPDNYCFERGAARTGAGKGWADVWKRGCFAWENKAPGKDLAAALKQLMTYALALENPPLLVVCDRQLIQIHTHFTGTPSEVHTIALDDIGAPENLQKLRWLFTDPERFRPQQTTYAATEQAAQHIGTLAGRLTARGEDPQKVAHFLIQSVFCMFAEDAGILPEHLFCNTLEKSRRNATKASRRLHTLFAAMQKGGDFGADDIPWFNGGLFAEINIPALDPMDVADLATAARLDWGAIEPAIFGTLFERGLNPDLRSQLGAHYSHPDTIQKINHPVIEAPLLAEWQIVKAQIESRKKHKDKQALFLGFLARLRDFRVLDPACGSGNFLYLALKSLKDIEHLVNAEAETLGLHRQLHMETGPANVLGLEINPYAAELARATVWIGELQWMLAHGYAYRNNPILDSLDHIEQRDALLTPDYAECQWPACDAIVGNPPFLGDKKMRSELGDDYTQRLRQCFNERVPGGADLVTYWFEKARAQIAAGHCQRAGLVTTNSIRGGANRKVLERIAESGHLFEAWSDEAWVVEGAAVRVSLVCFAGPSKLPVCRLNGISVAQIHPDLSTGDALDLTLAKPLATNAGVSFIGTQKNGPFDVPGEVARHWLTQPNPNGRPNSDVVRPWANGMDITRRPSDTWVIDFGVGRSESEAALYEMPFAHVLEKVKPARTGNRDARADKSWWLFQRSRPELRQAINGLERFIATSMVSKHRFFVWLPETQIPENLCVAITRNDDETFGILSSRIHTAWAFGQCTWLGVGNDSRYTTTTCFETFPFPSGLTPDLAPADYSNPARTAIAEAARALNEQRNNWLNPPQWITLERTPEEEAAGFPARVVPRPAYADQLKKQTLTNLYNQQPTWLKNAQAALDKAVATAYGWDDYTPALPDEEILRRLLALNLERAAGAASTPESI